MLFTDVGVKVQCHFRALLTKRIFTKYTFKQCCWSTARNISAKYFSGTLKKTATHLIPKQFGESASVVLVEVKRGPLRKKWGQDQHTLGVT